MRNSGAPWNDLLVKYSSMEHPLFCIIYNVIKWICNNDTVWRIPMLKSYEDMIE